MAAQLPLEATQLVPVAEPRRVASSHHNPHGLYAEAGAARIPNHHDFTLKYAELFGLALDPFEPPGLPAVYHVRGQRIQMIPGQKVEWPYDLTAEERALGLNGMRRKFTWSM